MFSWHTHQNVFGWIPVGQLQSWLMVKVLVVPCVTEVVEALVVELWYVWLQLRLIEEEKETPYPLASVLNLYSWVLVKFWPFVTVLDMVVVAALPCCTENVFEHTLAWPGWQICCCWICPNME